MDTFHVSILMVKVALDEAIDGFVLDIFSADIGLNTQHKMSLLLGRWQKKGNSLFK
jgi:hypothetical protein